MSRTLSFDEASAFGFDPTGRDGDRRFPYTDSDALAALHQKLDRLLVAGKLATADGSLPYTYDIAATLITPALAERWLATYPSLVEETGYGLGIPETAFNIDETDGRIDHLRPVGMSHVRLMWLLAEIDAQPARILNLAPSDLLPGDRLTRDPEIVVERVETTPRGTWVKFSHDDEGWLTKDVEIVRAQ